MRRRAPDAHPALGGARPAGLRRERFDVLLAGCAAGTLPGLPRDRASAAGRRSAWQDQRREEHLRRCGCRPRRSRGGRRGAQLWRQSARRAQVAGRYRAAILGSRGDVPAPSPGRVIRGGATVAPAGAVLGFPQHHGSAHTARRARAVPEGCRRRPARRVPATGGTAGDGAARSPGFPPSRSAVPRGWDRHAEFY